MEQILSTINLLDFVVERWKPENLPPNKRYALLELKNILENYHAFINNTPGNLEAKVMLSMLIDLKEQVEMLEDKVQLLRIRMDG